MADKCLAIPSRSILQLAILGVYMKRITYDSATVNISVFIDQRNISFQNDISLKTMRLGVLSWEKLKHCETHGRQNGLLHLITVPPPPTLGWGLLFSSYPWRLAKIAFTPEDFHKIWVYPWRIGSYPWRIWVYPWRISWKLRLHPQRIPYFFTLPLKKSSIFITYPKRIPWFLNRGVRILNSIAQSWAWTSFAWE